MLILMTQDVGFVSIATGFVMPKLYQSEAWLRRQYVVNRKTPEQIAKECDASHMTIYRYLRQFGLLK